VLKSNTKFPSEGPPKTLNNKGNKKERIKSRLYYEYMVEIL